MLKNNNSKVPKDLSLENEGLSFSFDDSDIESDGLSVESSSSLEDGIGLDTRDHDLEMSSDFKKIIKSKKSKDSDTEEESDTEEDEDSESDNETIIKETDKEIITSNLDKHRYLDYKALMEGTFYSVTELNKWAKEIEIDLYKKVEGKNKKKVKAELLSEIKEYYK